MSERELAILFERVAAVNNLIREFQGTVGFSLTLDRETGVLKDVTPVSFPGKARR